MNSEFNWWLLIVGLVIGAALVWVILADSARRESDVAERERDSEARWIGESIRQAGGGITDEEVLDVLELHAAYLAAPPPDDPWPEEESAEWLDGEATATDRDSPRDGTATAGRERAPLWPASRPGSADADENRLPRLARSPQVDERHAEARTGREA